ncbi:hypothetical protein M6D93_18495 [Jatrophihabitans telluris]|uniref:Uncharacterized protein n=1 Tax=Jatrophihabitans telluris TaxID=2038343 RepID=A0ABY4QZI5_9ACTN|nr:hypothetical protein [Jatrophihabitans telluris]UQX88254.1 hypothetical protein M6D93_18495 [Jatrophihabitans telluris]
MGASELDDKFGDRVQDLFNTTWAKAVAGTILFMVSVWLWGAGYTYVHHNGTQPMVRPLIWWQDQLAQLGIRYPRWLQSVTDWQAPNRGSAVLLVLVVAALAMSVAASSIQAPGYRLVGVLALVLGAQWFGLARTMRWYLLLVAALICLVALVAIWTKHNDSDLHFSSAYVLIKTIDGPLGFPALPLILPLSLIYKAVVTLRTRTLSRQKPIWYRLRCRT